MPRVGIDLRATEVGFKHHFGRGTGRYVSELYRELSKPSFDAGQCAIVPLHGTDLSGRTWERTLIRNLPFGRATFETQFLLPRRLSNSGLDIVHFFAHGDAPARGSTPYVVTVLDLIPLKFPELYKAHQPNWRYKFARYLELRAIRQARGIIAISEATKRDLIEMLDVAPEQIKVVPLAVGDNFTPIPATDNETLFRAKAELKGQLGFDPKNPILLYVGGIDPRKNVTFLLRVFADAKRKLSSLKPKLVFVGAYEREREFPQFCRDLQSLGLEPDVSLAGFVSDEVLPDYYRAADITVFPSLYEGFGFPVLESMACGTPVVASNNSSIPEVVGRDYPLLRDNDIAGWVEQIGALLSDPGTCVELRQRGLSQAQNFSWAETARLTAAAYSYFLCNNA